MDKLELVHSYFLLFNQFHFFYSDNPLYRSYQLGIRYIFHYERLNRSACIQEPISTDIEFDVFAGSFRNDPSVSRRFLGCIVRLSLEHTHISIIRCPNGGRSSHNIGGKDPRSPVPELLAPAPRSCLQN